MSVSACKAQDKIFIKKAVFTVPCALHAIKKQGTANNHRTRKYLRADELKLAQRQK